MNEMNRLRFILHVSDFHLNDNEDDLKHAKNALNVLTNELKSKRIKIDYLIHTGDIIDSSDLYKKTALLLRFCDQFWFDETTDSGEINKVFDVNRFKKEADYQNILDFDNKLEELTQKRFDNAIKVMRSFIVDLNLSFGNVVICGGNHDVLRLLSVNENEVKCKNNNENNWQYTFPEKYKRIYKPFKKFLNKLGVANKSYNNELVSYCSLNNLNFLILNTNSLNPGDQKNGYYCVNCEAVKASIEKLSKNDFAETLNIVLAHKPIYEICEKARLSYKRYLNTPFMNNLKKYIGDKGIYLCGDKHTRSIVRSYIHDIPHYISGEPLKRLENDAIFEVEYNLLEISDCSIGMERKIHIRNNETNWNCDIRPQDAVISKIYNYCKSHIVNNTFEMISDSKTISDWDDLYQELLSFGSDKLKLWYTNINTLFLSVCKYRKQGCFDIPLNDKNIFSFVLETINNQMKNIDTNNILNVRGEYSSGKSTFLGLLYIFLMYKYSVGAIDFIPAYFNIESNEVLQRISYNGSYHKAVKYAFDDFVKNVQEVADK